MEATLQLTKLPIITTTTLISSEESTLTVKNQDGPDIKFTMGQHAPQADLSIWVEQGLSRLLITFTVAPPPAHADFRPLTVDYFERSSAVGNIPGNFQRRELRQSDHEIRVSRLIDRALRPLFDAEERREVHLVVQVLSVDPKLDLIGLAITGAGLVSSCSTLPFNGPVLGASLLIEQEEEELTCVSCPAKQDFEWVLTTHLDGLVMIEGGAEEGLTPAKSLFNALRDFATDHESILDTLRDFCADYQDEKVVYDSPIEVVEHPAFDACISDLASALREQDKRMREHKYNFILENLKREVGADPSSVELTLWSLARAYLRSEALEGRRQDGRAPHEMRAYQIQAGVLPRASGSALVTRGSTQVLVSATQGGHSDSPSYETLFSQGRPNLFCHYNFPGYATHQIRPSRAPNRREIGHGLLIQRALTPLYMSQRGKSLRLLADVFSSDGSSSMASVIGANIALAQAGHHLGEPVVGISVGLVTDDHSQTGVLLMDISGDEDYYGDMDFKVVGGQNGISALQLDNKLGALPWSVVDTALDAATEAHVQLLQEINKHLEPFGAPKQRFTAEIDISPKLIGRVIGKQGETLKSTEREFNVQISVDKDTSQVSVQGEDKKKVNSALAKMRALGTPLNNGDEFEASIDGVKDFGVFVSFNHHSGLVHITQLRSGGGDATEHFKVGESLKVKVMGVDQKGRLKLSHLATRA